MADLAFGLGPANEMVTSHRGIVNSGFEPASARQDHACKSKALEVLSGLEMAVRPGSDPATPGSAGRYAASQDVPPYAAAGSFLSSCRTARIVLRVSLLLNRFRRARLTANRTGCSTRAITVER